MPAHHILHQPPEGALVQVEGGEGVGHETLHGVLRQILVILKVETGSRYGWTLTQQKGIISVIERKLKFDVKKIKDLILKPEMVSLNSAIGGDL